MQTYIFAACYTSILMTKITTIIFDLGGVVLNLNQQLTVDAFKALGVDMEAFSHVSTILHDFETGKIAADEFRETMLNLVDTKATTQQIDDAWNAMLLDLPEERIALIKFLRKKYKVLLLSNTNSIHIDAFNAYLAMHHPNLNWFDVFDKVYYSYQMGLRKPNIDIYEYVLEQHNLQPHQAIFIDDMLPNLEGAAQVGIHTIWAKQPLDADMVQEIENLVIDFTASMN